MGRNRSFDEDDVIALAAGVFLATGYEATSIDDLVKATGLHRGSLYKAFASKRGLFLSVLRRVLEQDPGSSVSLDLLLVATLELAPRDEEFRSVVAEALTRIGGAEGRGDPALILGRRLLERAELSF